MNKEHRTLFGRIQCHSLKAIQGPFQVEVTVPGWFGWPLFCPEAFIYLLCGSHWIAVLLSFTNEVSDFLPSGMEKAQSWMFLRTFDTLHRNYSTFMNWTLPSGRCKAVGGGGCLWSSAAMVPRERGRIVLDSEYHTVKKAHCRKGTGFTYSGIVSLSLSHEFRS